MAVTVPAPHGEPIEVTNPVLITAAQPADVVAKVSEPKYPKVDDELRNEL